MLCDNEFMTASEDCELKVWDKQLQGVSYTYEMKWPLKAANRTGETGNPKEIEKRYLVVGLGDGHFVNYGVEHRNEWKIEIWAHAHPIISIVSFSGQLKNKYFATRCSDGHVNIWSSTNQPEKIFSLWNIDGNEVELAHLQPQKEEAEVSPVKKKKRAADESGEEDEEEQEEEEEQSAEEDRKKKKKVLEPPVAPILIGRPEPSERDTMIELNWKGLINQSSAMLCISNFKESMILICNVDIKSRSREIKKELTISARPTFMYQINKDFLCVGTEIGNLEIFAINAHEPLIVQKKTIVAHPGSCYGVT